jgi:hypothetical protein
MKIGAKRAAENLLCTLFFYTVCSDCMRALQNGTGAFQKVDECLYRYSNGVYYGRIRVQGKEIKRSLHTTDREIARRKLADFRNQQWQTDRSAGKVTVAALCDEFLKAERALHHKTKTVERRELIVGRIKSDWPTGGFTQVAKVKPRDCDMCSRNTSLESHPAISTSPA